MAEPLSQQPSATWRLPMDDQPSVRVERAGGVATVTLDRPAARNAMTWQLIAQLGAALNEIAANEGDRAVVITGAGGNFSAGGDLSDRCAPRSHPLSTMRYGQELAMRLHTLPQPVIAKVRGVAVGAGCNLALGCDLVLASAESRFSQIFPLRGLSVDFGGSWLLPRLVGIHKAKELALLGEIISAAEAHAIGLINRVVPDGQLDGAVSSLASRLAAGPPIAMSLTKQLLNSSLQVAMAQALEDEARAQTINFATADSLEGIRAFRDRRAPRFTGQSLINDGAP
jgi:2-(1,2-epoxy-1,2-dihydrophenyl)acetyl-CoA isomerase